MNGAKYKQSNDKYFCLNSALFELVYGISHINSIKQIVNVVKCQVIVMIVSIYHGDSSK